MSPEQQRGASVQVESFLTVFTAVVSTLTHKKNVVFLNLVILMLLFQSLLCLHTVNIYTVYELGTLVDALA